MRSTAPARLSVLASASLYAPIAPKAPTIVRFASVDVAERRAEYGREDGTDYLPVALAS